MCAGLDGRLLYNTMYTKVSKLVHQKIVPLHSFFKHDTEINDDLKNQLNNCSMLIVWTQLIL